MGATESAESHPGGHRPISPISTDMIDASALRSLPVTEWSSDRPLKSLLSGSTIPLDAYDMWDQLLTCRISIEDATETIELMTSIVEAHPHFSTIGGVVQTLTVPEFKDINFGNIPPHLLIAASLRNKDTVMHMFIALMRTLFKFCDQGVYECHEGIIDGVKCDTAIEVALSFARCFATTPLPFFKNMREELKDLPAKDVLVASLDEDTEFSSERYSKPLDAIRPAWDQYAQTNLPFDFFLCMINILMFSRNYTIPAQWVEPFASDKVLHYHLPDEPRAWVHGVGCKMDNTDGVTFSKGLREDGVTDVMWERRRRLMKLLLVCVSEPYHLSASNWGFETVLVPGIKSQNPQPQFELSDGYYPTMAAAFIGGAVTLTSNLAVSILGLFEFALGHSDQVTNDGGWFSWGSSTTTTKYLSRPAKDCVGIAISLWTTVLGLNQELFTSRNTNARVRNVFPVILTNVGELVLNTERCSNGYDQEVGSGRLAKILRSLLGEYKRRMIQFSESCEDLDLLRVSEMSLLLQHFLSSTPYETTAGYMNDFMTEVMLVNLHLMYKLTTSDELGNMKDASRLNILVSVLHLHWRLSTIGRTAAWERHLTGRISSVQYWQTHMKNDITNIVALDADVSIGETIFLMMLTKLNRLWSGKDGHSENTTQTLFELISTTLLNFTYSVNNIGFRTAESLLSYIEMWSRYTTLLQKPKAPLMVEVYLNVLAALISHTKRNESEAFRNPYALYGLFRRIGDFTRLVEYEVPIASGSISEEPTEEPSPSPSINFPDGRQFLKWRDTLKPLRFINEVNSRAGQGLIEAIDADDGLSPGDILTMMQELMWPELRSVLVRSQRYVEYFTTGEAEFWFLMHHGETETQLHRGILLLTDTTECAITQQPIVYDYTQEPLNIKLSEEPRILN